ncbi:protein DGS1 [Citrus sinensis]|uniref:Protein DGS1 n=1 Tax=Citrus sinensis TaxID=2711 RepID=A0ACB8MWT8_CITSI|nr:protein DGS1 [Citrus sinensis]
MEGQSESGAEKDLKTLISSYSNYVWKRVATFFPSSGSNFLGKISILYPQASRKRRPFLPLPLPAHSLDSSVVMTEACRICDVLEDIMEHIFLNLHNIQKNLQFWQSRAEGSNAQKAYFMMFERGPFAFINGTAQILRDCMAEGGSIQHLCQSASVHISERITVLTTLRSSLATFLAQVYMEVEKYGEELVEDPEKLLPFLLVTINDLFSKLEASIGHLHATRQGDSSIDGSHSFPVLFEKLPEVNQEGSQWTDCEIKDSINLIYQNLQKLDVYLSHMVAKHQKPRKITRYWVHYTCGAVGLSFCSIWLLRHSSLMGSSDLENWICEAKDSMVGFFNDHVEQPLLSIRDELFETFRKRHKGVMEVEEVQMTSNSLHRMLLAFSEQTKGQKLPENASDQEMLEIVMSRYEKELMHPIQNLVNGELARALLIQVQKLKLDIETAMLELDQILRANEINFAVLAALPAFILSFILLMLVRAWFKQDSRAEGRGRVARIQRRLIIVEVEKRIMQYQIYVDQGLEKEAHCMFGLVLYSLDRLLHAVKGHAKETGEWQYVIMNSLRQDIIDLAKPGLQTAYKLRVTSRLERMYDCLLPSLKRQ